MVRKKIQVEDLDSIAKEHEFFVWNFVISGNYYLHIQSIFQEENSLRPNAMLQILDLIPVPYFETEVKDCYDFLMYLHPGLINGVWRGNRFQPFLATFNRKRLVGTTLSPYCYCPEKIIELIFELNPKFLIDSQN